MARGCILPPEVRALEDAKIRSYRDRIEGIARADGDPGRAAVKTFGGMAAFRGPDRSFVYGLTDADLPHLEAMFDWFAGVKPYVQTVAHDAGTGAAEALLARGYRPHGYMAVLAGPAGPRSPDAPPGVAVRALDAPEETFVDTYVRGYAWDAVTDEARHRLDVAAQYAGAPWRLCVAEVDGRAACIGALHLQGRVGFLANAATVADARNRGAHGAVLNWRIDRAAREGCDIVASDTAAFSGSHRNMARAGLALAYQRVRWKP